VAGPLRCLARALVLLLPAAVIATPLTLASSSPGPAESGLRALEQGDHASAIERWIEALRGAEREGRTADRITVLIHLADARLAVGQYRQAALDLRAALDLAEATGDARRPLLEAHLADALAPRGRTEVATELLTRSIRSARRAQDVRLLASALNTLGNVRAMEGKWADAASAYDESAGLAESQGERLLAARALINAAGAARQFGARAEDARPLLDAARRLLDALPASHERAFTLVALGVGYREHHVRFPSDAPPASLDAAGVLERAAREAEALGDRRTASYGWGHLGTLYEDEKRWAEALRLTRRAAFAAQQAGAPEALYRWQWQVGRLLRQTSTPEDAIGAYRRAVETLEAMRPELAVRYDSAPGSFRETVGPLFFDLVDLLLQRAGQSTDAARQADLLGEARDVVEALKVAELRDYFRDDCVEVARSRVTRIDDVSPTAAVVYPIVLPDRTELLVTLPGGLRRFVVPVSEARLGAEVRNFRRTLERRSTRQFLRPAQQIYRWIVAPLEAALVEARIDTLVFVPDGPLRSIPMGALHDGRQFLVSRYALAITPGVTLTAPRPLERRDLRLLAFGVTEAVQGFAALPEVEEELRAVGEMFPSTTLLNAQFSLASLEQRLRTERFSILHIASHGEFGGTVDKTFLLTFDGKVTLDRLDQLIGLFKFRDLPLELLTLSACDTAEGDDRAALGLAGVAIKAGARSAVATLWNINDRASARLIADFYRELRAPGISRAVALQRAQTRLLEDPRYQHPGFWAAYLLINNWL
jgi:CHAT domain-containing protein